MHCSGISDEAGASIEVQIQAHKELGWQYMELRLVDGVNLAVASDELCDRVYGAVSAAGLRVSGFGGTIGNWAKKISGDFQEDVDELARVIPRMHRFGARFLRIMTWPNDPDAPWEDAAWRDESLRRVRALTRMAEDGGIVMAIENCRGWAGLTPENAVWFLDAVDSPALRWLYDTGNVIGHGQEPWDFYSKVKPFIVYVHIKDRCRVSGETVYCGEGDAKVREILQDLTESGYDGFVSIEPHIAAVVHTGETSDPAVMYDTYVEYGRRLNAMLEGLTG